MTGNAAAFASKSCQSSVFKFREVNGIDKYALRRMLENLTSNASVHVVLIVGNLRLPCDLDAIEND